MSSEIANAIKQIAEEKNLSIESIVETIELALAAAYRKDFGNKQQNIKVTFDLENSSSRIFDIKEVVDDELVKRYQEEKEKHEAELAASETSPVPPASIKAQNKTNEEIDEDEEPRFNPKTMIGLMEASAVDKKLKIGDELKVELEVPDDYGRMAAQTAKQVIIQKIREAEREMIYDSFKEKEHELINGMVQRVEPKVVLVDLENTTGVMPQSEQIPSEFYRVGGRFKFYVKEVSQTPKGPEIVVSRAHPEVIRKLFSIEVPEIDAGSVVIRSIAREAGSRSKIAVAAKEENIDPIGSCVGQRGARVQTIINELGGEKIDIIEFNEDAGTFISNALSPAKVQKIEIDEEEHLGRAFVKTDQLSLAIGKGGQNVRLAAKLTGWRIDIVDDDSGEIKETGKEKEGQDETQEGSKESSEETPQKTTDKVMEGSPEENTEVATKITTVVEKNEQEKGMELEKEKKEATNDSTKDIPSENSSLDVAPDENSEAGEDEEKNSDKV